MSKECQSAHPARRRNSATFSDEDCRRIAADYDGTTQSVNGLLAQWSRSHPGLKRHMIIRAAKRGEYRPKRTRKDWCDEEDSYLAENWHRLSAEARTVTSLIIVAAARSATLNEPSSNAPRKLVLLQGKRDLVLGELALPHDMLPALSGR